MTKEDIIRMAREAGLLAEDEAWVSPHQASMERFAALVAAAERERCAQICDSVAANAVLGTAGECARTIRGEK
jgi:hypothetical protein